MKFYGGRNVQDGDETSYDKQFFGGFSHPPLPRPVVNSGTKKPRTLVRGFEIVDGRGAQLAVTSAGFTSSTGSSAPKGSVIRSFLYCGRPVPAGIR